MGFGHFGIGKDDHSPRTPERTHSNGGSDPFHHNNAHNHTGEKDNGSGPNQGKFPFLGSKPSLNNLGSSGRNLGALFGVIGGVTAGGSKGR